MASIVIDPTDHCISLVCGAGESDVTLEVAAIYAAWKDWFLEGDNSKYLPALDSAGGNPAGGASLDNVYFLLTENGWRICPVTTESSVTIRLTGNLFPDVPGAVMFGYDEVVAGGHTHIETVVSTSARYVEVGGSCLTPTESAVLSLIPALL